LCESIIRLVVSSLGWSSRYIIDEFTNAYLGSSSIDENIDKKLYTYYPASQQVLVFFTAFHIKKFYDAIFVNDGPLFIFHHVASLSTSAASILTHTANLLLYILHGDI